jgi:hypothetical protein
MLDEICMPVTMRLVGLGHSLYEAQCLAAGIVLHLVLLCTLLGYRVVPPDEVRPAYPAVVRACIVPVPGIRGSLPAGAGTAGSPRSFLHS